MIATQNGKEIWFEHRVSYGETDTMGVLYYAEYLHIFERARSQFIRELGMSYSEVEALGVFLPVREATCRYRRSAKYDDLLFVRTWISAWGKASMCFAYEFYDETKKILLATGSTHHAFVNQTGKPVAVPVWFREMAK